MQRRRLRVSNNQRFLVEDDEKPFFYLGDTAWELFHRLTLAEAEYYLDDRAAKGFTVIQAVALAEFDGLTVPNANGDLPLHDLDPTRPNEAYFRHVDAIVHAAAFRGLFVGLLPTWGDKWNRQWGKGPEVFTPDNARVYGEWLGQRYADQPILWILGGDRRVVTQDHVRILRAMAAGIRAAVGSTQLITFHPQGQETSSLYWQCDEWCDFNMYQTGHTFDRDNGRSIAQDYARTPIKPCLDAEPGYEDHPNAWKPETGYLDDVECRKFLWWGLFAGACGHTYGCHDIWQFWEPGREPVSAARTPWWEALQLPGAAQMQYARDLLLARPYLTRIPDNTVLLRAEDDAVAARVRATRDAEGRYLLVYAPEGQAFTLRLDRLAGPLRAAWFDPRTSETAPSFATFDPTGEHTFTPPTSGRGQDWVLTLDV